MSRYALLLAAVTLLGASPALAGPPWIAIEYPANPHHPSTRGAALLVRAYHHSTAIGMPVRGTAEGIVNGQRVSRPLDLRPTNITGVYALRSELPAGGAWVLAISVEQGKDDAATALVTLDGKGGIAHVEVPASTNREGWTIPRAVKPADIEHALQLAAVGDGNAVRNASALTAERGRAALAGMLGLPLLLGLILRRQRARR